MKKINIIIICTAIISFFLSGCKKELEIREADSYSQIYIPQAVDNPVSISMSITDQVFEVPFNAFLGGPVSAKREVPVTFTVSPELIDSFNLAHNTAYEMLPEGSYTLPAASTVIPAGSQSTGTLILGINTLGFIEPFETYILPLKLTQPGDIQKLNMDLNVIYYLFTGSYAPGEVPREKVLSLGANAGSSIIDFNGDFIYKAPSGDLKLFKVEAATGLFTEPSKTISSGWNVINKIVFFGGNRLIARFADDPGNINQYVLSQEGNFGAQREVGQGWGVLKDIVPFKGLLLGIFPNGDMTQFPLNEFGDFNYGDIRGIGTGWAGFNQIFPYQNSLIAIEANGDMWQYPLSDDGVFGSRKKVGTGWNMYVKVITAGTDLLALDNQGDLWRYKFNPSGLWPLKK